MTARLPIVVVLLGAALGAPSADAGKKPGPKPAVPDEAADKKSRAQKLVGEARALFDKGVFPEAIAKFEEAYRLFPVPKMFYNLGITYDAIHRDDRAVCALERFIAEVPDADATLRKDSEDRLSRLRPTVGRIEVDAPDGAVLFIDGEERATAPSRVPLCAAEGRHRVVAVTTGAAPVGLDLTVRQGALLKVALDPAGNNARLLSDSGASKTPVALLPAATPDPSRPGDGVSTPVWKKGWFWVVIGVVAAGAATGIVFATRPAEVTPPSADFPPVAVFQ